MVSDDEDDFGLIDFGLQLMMTLGREFRSVEIVSDLEDSEVLPLVVVDEAAAVVRPVAAVQPGVDQPYQLTLLNE